MDRLVFFEGIENRRVLGSIPSPAPLFKEPAQKAGFCFWASPPLDGPESGFYRNKVVPDQLLWSGRRVLQHVARGRPDSINIPCNGYWR